MKRATDRPAKPPPLRPGDEASKAAWRAYLTACAKADEALLRQSRAGIRRSNPLADRLN